MPVMRNALIVLTIGAVALAAYLMTRDAAEPNQRESPSAAAEPSDPTPPTPASSRYDRRAPPTLQPQAKVPTFRRLGARDQSRAGDGNGPRGERRRQRRELFDTNGDGQLDEAERAAMREGRSARRRARTLESFDDDADGALNEDEQAMLDTARKDMTADRAARMLRNADADEDGKISRDEAEASGRRMSRVLRDFDAVDSDGDALISDAELQKAIAERRERRERRGREQPAATPN